MHRHLTLLALSFTLVFGDHCRHVGEHTPEPHAEWKIKARKEDLDFGCE